MKVVSKDNGKFGLMRITSGCVYGDFDTYEEAAEALAMSRAVVHSDPIHY